MKLSSFPPCPALPAITVLSLQMLSNPRLSALRPWNLGTQGSHGKASSVLPVWQESSNNIESISRHPEVLAIEYSGNLPEWLLAYGSCYGYITVIHTFLKGECKYLTFCSICVCSCVYKWSVYCWKQIICPFFTQKYIRVLLTKVFSLLQGSKTQGLGFWNPCGSVTVLSSFSFVANALWRVVKVGEIIRRAAALW